MKTLGLGLGILLAACGSVDMSSTHELEVVADAGLEANQLPVCGPSNSGELWFYAGFECECGWYYPPPLPDGGTVQYWVWACDSLTSYYSDGGVVTP